MKKSQLKEIIKETITENKISSNTNKIKLLLTNCKQSLEKFAINNNIQL